MVMTFKIGVFWIVLLNPLNVWAQIDGRFIGARAQGIGNISSPLQEANALFQNPAGMSSEQPYQILLGYSNALRHSSFQNFGVGFIWDSKAKGALGMSLSRFGDLVYQELKMGLSYRYTLAEGAVGLRLNYIEVIQSELSSPQTLLIEIGGMYSLLPNLRLGAHIYNINRAKFRSRQGEDEYLPILMRLGLAYQLNVRTVVLSELEQEIGELLALKIGLEYQISGAFWLRAGIHRQGAHFGLGMKVKTWQMDLAFRLDNAPGPGFHSSLAYGFPPKRFSNEE